MGDVGHQILLLAADPLALRAMDLSMVEDLSLNVTAACALPVTEGSLPVPAHQLSPADGVHPFVPRTLAARAKTALVARRDDVPLRALWAVKGDPWVRGVLRETGVVVSADPDTDRVLDHVGELVRDTVVVQHAQSAGFWSALRSLEDVLASRPDSGDDETVDGLKALVDPAQAQLVPPFLLTPHRAAITVRHLNMTMGPRRTAEVIVSTLAHYRWEEVSDAGTTGLSAQLAMASIDMATDQDRFPPEPALAAAAEAALTGADEALACGERGLARARLSDAMALLFHRERHAETVHSPLVMDPAGHLGALYASRTFRELVAGGRRPRAKPHVPIEDGLRVQAFGGSYGDFHRPVIAALRQVSSVSFRSPQKIDRFFTHRGVDPQFLDALAQLRALGPEPEDDEWSVRDLVSDVNQILLPRLRRADVVFTDWADRVTVWVSHLARPDCRLVVRIHSLDALDPFFHLVDWGAVDEVIVVSEPLRRLVVSLLEVAGADVPVTILPNFAALREMDQPKDPEARTTLGMVGWSRRVKDPLWALDLLAREPSWRLVLIGPDQPASSPSARAYADEVERRLQDPALRERIEVVGATREVATHLRKVGVILSTSRRESWHLGLVEGAASGAVPVVRNWPVFAPIGGARALFPQEWVVETLDEAEQRIRELTADPAVWESARRDAQQQALALFDPSPAEQRYREVILGPLLPD